MEELSPACTVFQADSEMVQTVYRERENYLIEYTPGGDKEYCAVYFSSNDIYYPNTEEIFRKRIVDKDFYEWYHSRIRKAYKHIFLRDVFKQWYLKGINANIGSPGELGEFLKKETSGYKTILLGSSAGAYAAILYGSLLQSDCVLAFNPQFELASLLERSTEQTNPLLFRLKDSPLRKYFDITPFINPQTDIFYLYSMHSPWDRQQNAYLDKQGIKGIHKIPFSSAHHGIPFLKVALPKVLDMGKPQLMAYVGRVQHPIWFTIKMAGIAKTISGFAKQAYQAYKKRH